MNTNRPYNLPPELPDPPQPPAGHRGVYRGKGWKPDDAKPYIFADDEHPVWQEYRRRPHGQSCGHYIEWVAIDAPEPVAEAAAPFPWPLNPAKEVRIKWEQLEQKDRPAKAREWWLDICKDSLPHWSNLYGEPNPEYGYIHVREVRADEAGLLEEAVGHLRYLVDNVGCTNKARGWLDANFPTPAQEPFDYQSYLSKLSPWIQSICMNEDGSWHECFGVPRPGAGWWISEGKNFREIPKEFAPPAVADWKLSEATTMIGGVPLCAAHGDRSGMKPAPTDKDSLGVEPIIARLKDVQHRIGEMCSNGTPPRMSIPARPEVDDDIVISRTCDAAIEAIANWQARAEAAAIELDYHKKSTAQLYLIAREGFGLDETIGGESCFDYVMRQLEIIRSKLSASQAEVRRLREAIQSHKENFPDEPLMHDLALWEALSPAEKGGEG